MREIKRAILIEDIGGGYIKVTYAAPYPEESISVVMEASREGDFFHSSKIALDDLSDIRETGTESPSKLPPFGEMTPECMAEILADMSYEESGKVLARSVEIMLERRVEKEKRKQKESK